MATIAIVPPPAFASASAPASPKAADNKDATLTADAPSPAAAAAAVAFEYPPMHEPPPSRPTSVPTVPKWVVGLALVQVALSAGVVYGWPSLLRALIRNHQFEELCAAGDTLPCNAQTLALNLVFVAGSWSAQGARIVPGAIVDRYGLAYGACFSHALVAVGSLLFAASDSRGFDGFLAGYLVMGFGGGGVQLAMVTVAGYFPRYATHLTNTVQGCFNAGAFVFLLFDAWNEAAPATSLGAMFYGYAVVQAALAVAVFVIWKGRPRPGVRASAQVQPQPTAQQPPQPQGIELTANPVSAVSSAAASSSAGTSQPPAASGTVAVAVASPSSSRPRPVPVFSASAPPPPFWRAVATRRYALLLLAFSVYTLANQFYHGTVAAQVARRLGGDTAAQDTGSLYASRFNLIYALIGFLCPAIGAAIHRFGFLHSFRFIAAMHVAYWTVTVLPAATVPVAVQYAAFPLYALGRATKYGAYFSILGSPAQFGNVGPLFGRLSGLGLLVSAVVSVLQYLLLWIVSGPAGGSFLGVNLVLLLLAVPLVPLHRLHTQSLADELAALDAEYGSGGGGDGDSTQHKPLSVSKPAATANADTAVAPEPAPPTTSVVVPVDGAR